MSEELLKEIAASLRMLLRHALTMESGGGCPENEILDQLRKLDKLIGPYEAHPPSGGKRPLKDRPRYESGRLKPTKAEAGQQAKDAFFGQREESHTFIHQMKPEPFVDRPPPVHKAPEEPLPKVDTNELMRQRALHAKPAPGLKKDGTPKAKPGPKPKASRPEPETPRNTRPETPSASTEQPKTAKRKKHPVWDPKDIYAS